MQYTTVFTGFIAAVFGGKPAMITGVAGAMVVVSKAVTDPDGDFGAFSKPERVQLLFITCFFAGLFQIAAGLTGLARFMRLLPKTAMIGFLNGLAIVIFMSQLHTFKVPIPGEFDADGEPVERWYTLSEAETWLMLLYVVMSMATMVLLPRLTKAIPASLVALIICTGFEHGITRPLIGMETRIVLDKTSLKGDFPPFAWPNVPWDGDTQGKVLSVAVSLALVGLVESLMTMQATSAILGTVTTNWEATQEFVAQGAGNLVSSLFGSAIGGGESLNSPFFFLLLL